MLHPFMLPPHSLISIWGYLPQVAGELVNEENTQNVTEREQEKLKVRAQEMRDAGLEIGREAEAERCLQEEHARQSETEAGTKTESSCSQVLGRS